MQAGAATIPIGFGSESSFRYLPAKICVLSNSSFL